MTLDPTFDHGYERRLKLDGLYTHPPGNGGDSLISGIGLSPL